MPAANAANAPGNDPSCKPTAVFVRRVTSRTATLDANIVSGTRPRPTNSANTTDCNASRPARATSTAANASRRTGSGHSRTASTETSESSFTNTSSTLPTTTDSQWQRPKITRSAAQRHPPVVRPAPLTEPRTPGGDARYTG